MAGFVTDLVNNKVLDAIFGGEDLERTSTLHIGLTLKEANKSGFVAEPTGGGYARASVVNDLRTWPAAIGGAKANATSILFPAPTADWGWVVGVFVADAAAGGNVLAMADLRRPVYIRGGQAAPSISVGALLLSHS